MAKSKRMVSQKTRFEVFKRDSFTCQYCGKSAPHVILHVDHINPIAECGDNDILNLVTACIECNQGKGKRKLSDDAVVTMQMDELKNLQAKREQFEMILQWRKELRELQERAIGHARIFFQDNFDEYISPYRMTQELNKIDGLVYKFGINMVMDAIEIASYSNCDKRGAIRYIAGICWKKKELEK